MAVIYHCYCTGVTHKRVLQAIAATRARTVEEVRRACGACSGCQGCRPELEQLLAEVAAGRLSVLPPPPRLA